MSHSTLVFRRGVGAALVVVLLASLAPAAGALPPWPATDFGASAWCLAVRLAAGIFGFGDRPAAQGEAGAGDGPFSVPLAEPAGPDRSPVGAKSGPEYDPNGHQVPAPGEGRSQVGVGDPPAQ